MCVGEWCVTDCSVHRGHVSLFSITCGGMAMQRLASLGLLLSASALFAIKLAPCSADEPASRKLFKNSVVPLPDQATAHQMAVNVQSLSPRHQDETMQVLFSLQLPPGKRAQLQERIDKGDVIPPGEVAKSYAVDPTELAKLVGFLKDQGFAVTYTSPDGTSVYARATVSQLQKTLQVTMARVTFEGVTYNAATTAPSLPANVAGPVYAIVGLQPFRHATKQSRRVSPVNARGHARSTAAALGPNVASQPPYLVREILAAYNADKLGLTGEGQTIAIIIDTVPDDADLAAFWQNNGLSISSSQVQKINVNGVQLPSPDGEETLDVEWASGIAPKANVRVYASGSLQFVDLDKALDRLIADLPLHPEIRQVSISLGLGETYMPGGVSGESLTESAKFLTLAASGVNVFVSSGDAGSNPGPDGHMSNGPLQVEYQSSDPNVIAVGGTVLYLKPDNSVDSETAWVGSGGGKSVLFSRPSWQTAKGMPPGTDRLVPDVCLAAAPQTGAYVFLHGQEAQYGGTSWSAPVWAGFCALLNEGQVKKNKPRLPYLNPTLYRHASTDAFRDITDGANGEWSAGQDYDLVTGLGAPRLDVLHTVLSK